MDTWCAFRSSFSLFIQPLKVLCGPQAGNPRTELLQSERRSNVQSEKYFGWRFEESFVKYNDEQSLHTRWSSWRVFFKTSQTGDVKEGKWILVVEAKESEAYVSQQRGRWGSKTSFAYLEHSQSFVARRNLTRFSIHNTCLLVFGDCISGRRA